MPTKCVTIERTVRAKDLTLREINQELVKKKKPKSRSTELVHLNYRREAEQPCSEFTLKFRHVDLNKTFFFSTKILVCQHFKIICIGSFFLGHFNITS